MFMLKDRYMGSSACSINVLVVLNRGLSFGKTVVLRYPEIETGVKHSPRD